MMLIKTYKKTETIELYFLTKNFFWNTLPKRARTWDYILKWISLNSMGKIAKGADKIHFTILYDNYFYIFTQNFS